MSKTKKSKTAQFWMVVLGIFLVIGLVSVGTYSLNEQGLIGTGNMAPGGAPGESAEGEMPEFDEASMLAPPDREGGDLGFNSQGLIGILIMVLQITLLVVLVAAGQWLFPWLRSRRSRAPVQAG